MAKLKYDMYKRGIEAEEKFLNRVEEFENNIVGAVERNIEELKLEQQDLERETTIITIETDMDELMEKKRRLKEIPQLIQEAQGELSLVKKEKQQYVDEYGKGIAKSIGMAYLDEFQDNAEILAEEYDKALTKLIEIDKKLRKLEEDYNRGIGAIRSCRGVYLTANKNPILAEIIHKHNLNNMTLDLRGAI